MLFESDLHLIYLLTSVNRYDNANSISFNFENTFQNDTILIKWQKFLKILQDDIYNPVLKKIIQTCTREDVSDAWISVLINMLGCSSGINDNKSTKTRYVPARIKQSLNLQIRIKRLHRAYILNDICQEIPFAEICEKYCIERGDLLRIYSESGQFAGMVHVFCKELNYNSFAKMIRKVLKYGYLIKKINFHTQIS